MDDLQPMWEDVPWYGVRCNAGSAVPPATSDPTVPNHVNSNHDYGKPHPGSAQPGDVQRRDEKRTAGNESSSKAWFAEVFPAKEMSIPLFLVAMVPVSFQITGGVPYLEYIAVAALLVASVVLLGGWGYRQLKKRNDRLEKLVEQRTARIQLQARQLARYNTELIRSNKVLQHTVEEKSKVLGVAAHDLKNPIFGIRALSELMLEEDTDRDVRAHRLSLIHVYMVRWRSDRFTWPILPNWSRIAFRHRPNVKGKPLCASCCRLRRVSKATKTGYVRPSTILLAMR